MIFKAPLRATSDRLRRVIFVFFTLYDKTRLAKIAVELRVAPPEMKMDRDWLMDVAGWKAVKAGRTIVGAGAVLESAFDGKVLRGVVRAGSRQYKSGMVIHSESEVENLCRCRESEREGILCSHSVAVGLAWSEKGSQGSTEQSEGGAPPEKPKKAAPVAAMIELPPNFTKDLAQGRLRALIRPRGAEAEGGSASADQRFGDWLAAAGVDTLPAPLGLAGADVDSFLRALEGHPGVHFPGGQGGAALRIGGVARRPEISVRFDDNGGAQFTLVELEEDVMGTWWWSAESLLLLPAPTAEGQVGMLLSQLLVEGKAEGTIGWVFDHLAELGAVFTLDEEVLGGTRVQTARPEIRVEVEGSFRRIDLNVVALYPGREIIAGDPRASSELGFPLSGEGEVDWLLRNRPVEELAMRTLEGAGFLREEDPDPGCLYLRGEAEVLGFFASGISALKARGWEVSLGERITHMTEQLVEISPRLRVQGGNDEEAFEGGGGRNRGWLNYELSFTDTAGEVQIPRAEIQKLLSGKTRTTKLPDGRQALVNLDAAQGLEGALTDCAVEMLAGGGFEAPSEMAGYLGAFTNEGVVEGLDSAPIADLETRLGDLHEKLRPYQLEGVEWMVRQVTAGRGALLADEMGLGKTVQTLAVLRYLLAADEADGQEKAPTLVVCPKSLLGNWAAEATKFVPEMSTLIYHGTGRDALRDELTGADLVFTTYGVVAGERAFFAQADWRALVLDEASLLRNPDTDASKAIRAVDAPARIALTGTPIENTAGDLWSIFAILQPGYLGERKVFGDAYVKPLKSSEPDAAVADRLKKRIAPFILRRRKELVATDLPKKLERSELLDLSPREASLYRQILEEGQAKIDALGDNQQGARMTMLTTLLRLRQLCCEPRLLGIKGGGAAEDQAPPRGAKLERALELLGTLREGGHRTLVFSQFAQMLKIFAVELQAAGVPFCYLDGSTRKRAEEVQRFQENGEIPVFLISLKAGGYGLNLTAADTVMHYDPWWNPAVEAQATDRAHRIGQERPVQVLRCVCAGTVEEKILQLQEEKRGIVDATIDDGQPMMGGLQDSDLQSLLEV